MKDKEWSSQEIGKACLCTNLRQVTRIITKHYEQVFRPLEITPGQFTIIALLKDKESLSMNEASGLLDMDRTTTTANLRPLMRRGLVEVSNNEVDKRVKDITLTSKGRSLLKKAIPLWEEAQESTKKMLLNGAGDFLETLKELKQIKEV